MLLQFVIAWLLQFSTTVVTIYDRYYNLRRLLFQFTTGITIHDIITIHDRTHVRPACPGVQVMPAPRSCDRPPRSDPPSCAPPSFTTDKNKRTLIFSIFLNLSQSSTCMQGVRRI